MGVTASAKSSVENHCGVALISRGMMSSILVRSIGFRFQHQLSRTLSSFVSVRLTCRQSTSQQLIERETTLPHTVIKFIKYTTTTRNDSSSTMKTTCVLALGLVASVQGFAPVNQPARANTELSETLFDKIFGMDLFEPVKDQNDYGARKKKNVSITSCIGEF